MKAANALVSSWFDCCNLLSRSLSGFNVRNLQSIHNSFARIVTNTTRDAYITVALKSFLSVHNRKEYNHLYTAKLMQHSLMHLCPKKGKSRDVLGQNPKLAPAREDVVEAVQV